MSKKSKQRKINREVSKTLRAIADSMKVSSDFDLLISHRVSLLESAAKRIEGRSKTTK